jgi:methyl-accepting chemotaxis protein
MAVLSSAAFFMWQETVAAAPHDVMWIRIFLGIIAISFLVQAAGMVVAGLFGAKLFKKAMHLSELVEHKALPLLNKAEALVDELTPKVRTITQNVEEVSTTVREKAEELSKTVDELNRTVRDVNMRTHLQVQRVDGLVSEALDTTQEVSRTVQDSIKKPVRQIAGIIAGFKAGLETLAARSPFSGRTRESAERPFEF